MSICIVDTSVLCSILGVPGKDQHHDEALRTLEVHISGDVSMLLPLAAVYETGNHIAQQGSGGRRRKVAEAFSRQVRQAFDGQAPWTPTPIHQAKDILAWLDEFPDWAMRHVGIGDLSVIQVFKDQCALNPARRVFVWSYDAHLQAYERSP